MYMLIQLGVWMLVNYVYVDSNGFLNACKLCVVDSTGFWMLVNYVYVDSNGFYNTCKLCICWFQWIL